MEQEAFDTSPAVRHACAASILGHAETLEADFAAALAAAGSGGEVDAASLALHTQTVLQGEFVLSKAAGDSDFVIEAIDHLHRYVQCALGRTST